MKKLLILIVVVSVSFSCKKENPEPTNEQNPNVVNSSYTLNFLSMDPNVQLTLGGTYFANYFVAINGTIINGNLNQHLSLRSNYQIVEDFVNNGTPPPTNGLQVDIEEGTSYNVKILDAENNTELISFDGIITTEDGQKYFNTSNITWNTAYLDSKFTNGWDDEGTHTDWMYGIDNKFFLTVGIVNF